VKLAQKWRKAGRELAPVQIAGRTIARSFWGSAWCDNLEAYSDFANRLPRGRTYVRNGSVIDLQIVNGKVSALVSGSDLYAVDLRIRPLAARKWKQIRSHCAGQIRSLVELLQGHISDAVMEIVTRRGTGLFPAPREISLDCSCPDWATMCKHVAAVLYGVGARLDHAPELLFELRGVDPAELAAGALEQMPTRRKPTRARVLAEDDLASVFGIELEVGEAKRSKGAGTKRARGRAAGAKRAVRRKSAKKKAVKKVARKKLRPGKKTSRKRAAAAKGSGKKLARKKGTKKTAKRAVRKRPSPRRPRTRR